MRVVVADDDTLLRAGIIELLKLRGVEVVGHAGDPERLLEVVAATLPDVAIVDIRMPPTHTLEGLEAAARIRSQFDGAVAILLLSQHVEAHHAGELLSIRPAGVGYLLKDRILDPTDLLSALQQVAAGGTVVDPVVVEQLLNRRRTSEPLAALTARELEVLAAMAEGRSNQWIADNLYITTKTVEAHTSRIFTKLGLEDSPDDHRRVLAVLTYLRRG